MEVGDTLSVPVSRFGKAWAKKKFGDPAYMDIMALGRLKKPETKTQKALITMRFDEKDYFLSIKSCQPCPSQAGGSCKFMNEDGEEVEMEISEEEEEELEDKQEDQKEEKKQQVPEEENDENEEGGEDEVPPAYNPSPYTPQQVAEEKAKLSAKGFHWVLGPQTVDWSSDRPLHKARTTMDPKFDISPLL